MARYKVVPVAEAERLRLPCWVEHRYQEALDEAAHQTRKDENVGVVLYHPDHEAADWSRALRENGPWAVVEDRDPPRWSAADVVNLEVGLTGSHVKADQKVTRAAADGKARVELLPSDAVLALADVFTYGALKYQEDNWRLAADDPTGRKRYAAAAIRHALAIIKGEVLDPESGLPHWDHLGASAAMGREIDPETRGKRFTMKVPPVPVGPSREGA